MVKNKQKQNRSIFCIYSKHTVFIYNDDYIYTFLYFYFYFFFKLTFLKGILTFYFFLTCEFKV